MTAQLSHFLAMGGYAAYVWPAYGVAALILGGLTLVSVWEARAVRQELHRRQTPSPLMGEGWGGGDASARPKNLDASASPPPKSSPIKGEDLSQGGWR